MSPCDISIGSIGIYCLNERAVAIYFILMLFFGYVTIFHYICGKFEIMENPRYPVGMQTFSKIIDDSYELNTFLFVLKNGNLFYLGVNHCLDQC